MERSGGRATGAGCWRASWPAASCPSCAWRCPTAPGSSPSWRWSWARAGVNIADLALYPAPDMSEGVVALWLRRRRRRPIRPRAIIEALGHPCSGRERPLRALGAAARAPSALPGRQVDLPPGRDHRRDGLRAGADHAATWTPPTPARRSPPCGRWARSSERRDRRARRLRGVGLRSAQSPAGPIDVGNAGHADAAAARLAGRPARRDVHAGRRSTRSGAGRSTGSPSPLRQMGARIEATRRALPAVHGSPARRSRGIDYELPVASAQVKSCVLLAGLMTAGHDRDRAGPQPRPHRADAAAGRGADRAREVNADGGWRTTVGGADELELERHPTCPATSPRPRS